MTEKLIAGFEYCENDQFYLGIFESESEFIEYALNWHKKPELTRTYDFKRAGLERLDWGMDCTFKTEYSSSITKFGYQVANMKR